MMHGRTNKQKLYSLEGIRGLAFLMIMFAHTKLSYLPIRGLGGAGVTIFFMLNGFLMTYNYYDYDDKFGKLDFKHNFRFSLKKIYRLYPLHIITMLMMVVFDFLGPHKESLIKSFITIGLNTFLIDEWFPFSYSIRFANGVSWFLCTLLFANFMFPWALTYLKNKKRISLVILLIVAIIIQILIGVISTFFPEAPLVEGQILDNRLTVWLVYYFPMTRFIDIFIGYILGVLYINSSIQKIQHNLFNSIAEVITLVVLTVVVVFSNQIRLNADIIHPNFNHPQIWWAYSIIFVLPTMLVVWIFAKGEGIVSKFLENKIVLYLASISGYGFLIHYVVFQYIIKFLLHFDNISQFVSVYMNLIVAILGIPITIFLSLIWKRIQKYFIIKKYIRLLK